MMWDNAIRGEFRLNPDPDGYRELLERSRREAEVLIEDAESCGVGVQEAPTEARARTLSKVLDAYHWITITRRHTIPSRKEVQQWLKWVWR